MSLLVFETEEDEAADLYNKKEGHKVVLFRGTVHDVAGYPAGEDILANDLGSNIEEKAKEAKHTKAVKPIFKDLPVVGRLKLTQSTSSRKGRHVITKGKTARIDGSRINRKLDFGYSGPGTLFNHNNLATICTAVGTNYRTPPSPYYCPQSEEKICIKIHNDWYDISKFAPYHPGGQVIYEYAGCDATEVFTAFHVHQDSKILKWLKKIPPQEIENSNLIRNEGAAAKEAIDLKFSKDMDDMIQKMKDDGLFKPNLYYMVLKILLTAFFFFAGWHQTFQATRRARHLNLDSEIDWKQLTFAAALITLFIQQSGFLLHDFMHNNWFHNRRIDQGFGRFFGSICMGISGLWWRDEHWIHHIFTNTYEH
jgi:delta8-fatty-acid desaturase